MKILIIVNSPKRPNSNKIDMYTGYGVYVNTLIDHLESQHHEVDTLSFFDEYPLHLNISGLYEPHYLNSEDIADSLHLKCLGYERIIINGNIPLPLSFCLSDTTISRATYVLHDPAHLDAMYGFEDMKLRDYCDWTEDYLFHPTRQKKLEDNYKNHIGDFFSLSMEDLKTYYYGQTSVYKESDVVVPSPQYKRLLQGCSNVESRVLPHFLPITGYPPAPKRTLNNEVVTIAAWCKIDIVHYLQVVLDNPTYKFTLFAGTQVVQAIQPLFKWFGRPKNLVILDILTQKDFYEHLSNSTYSMCYHPTRIFETFGYIPYEMSHFGIRTQILSGFSGITESVKYTDTVISDSFTSRRIIHKELESLPTPLDYIHSLLDGEI